MAPFNLVLNSTVKAPEDVANTKAVWRQSSFQVQGDVLRCFQFLLRDFQWHGFTPAVLYYNTIGFCKADSIDANENDNGFLIYVKINK